MTSYFEHFGGKGRKPDVALDVIEFEPVETPSAIEVEEKTFDDTGQFRAYVARETGRGSC